MPPKSTSSSFPCHHEVSQPDKYIYLWDHTYKHQLKMQSQFHAQLQLIWGNQRTRSVFGRPNQTCTSTNHYSQPTPNLTKPHRRREVSMLENAPIPRVCKDLGLFRRFDTSPSEADRSI